MRTPAAQYVRMSTEHQQYSIVNQSARIREYAAEHDFDIVKTYADSGRSGVILKNRPALSSLIADVVSTTCEFKAVLVYDVSRWGRFQDTDEAAHYEFLCKRAGVPVHYCAEQFAKDGTMSSSLLKTLKRTMAAEFSRELGTKVYHGQARLVRMGFRVGAIPGYGLRRMMVSADGQEKGLLRKGDHKSYTKDRIILVPGTIEEQEVVRRIYEYRLKGIRCKQIATLLNEQKIPFIDNREWHYWTVLEVLRNPKYAGFSIWGRTDQRLSGPTVRIPRDKWVACAAAFKPIVDLQTFERVQAKLDDHRLYTDAQMLDALRSILAKYGRISRVLIGTARRTKDVPCVTQYHRRFGNLLNAYNQIGYQQKVRELPYAEHRIRSERLRDYVVRRVVAFSNGRIVLLDRGKRLRPLLELDNKITLDILICPRRETIAPPRRWFSYPHHLDEPTNFTIACLLTDCNTKIAKVFLLPGNTERHRMKEVDFVAKGIRLRKPSRCADLCYSQKWLDLRCRPRED